MYQQWIPDSCWMLLPQATLTPHPNSKCSEQAAITGTLPFFDGWPELYYYTSKTDENIPIHDVENRRELNGSSSQFTKKDINRKEANSPIHKHLQKSYKYHAMYRGILNHIVWNHYSNCYNYSICYLLFPNHSSCSIVPICKWRPWSLPVEGTGHIGLGMSPICKLTEPRFVCSFIVEPPCQQ